MQTSVQDVRYAPRLLGRARPEHQQPGEDHKSGASEDEYAEIEEAETG